MRGLVAVALWVCITTSVAGAQTAPRTVAPGMTRAQVVAALGAPATVRTVAEFTYLFYRNSCGTRCGMNDLVVLRADSVVDAIFRSPSRRYTGVSSSPAPISARDAARAEPTRGSASPTASPGAASPSPRLRPPAEANDVRPSIPLNPPQVRAAPSSPPATRSP